MGYLAQNTPPTRHWAICEDLYPLRLTIVPKFSSDDGLAFIIKDVLPDVEDWQFSGRRFRLLSPFQQPNPLPSTAYAINSRKMRPREEFVVFAFHDLDQRTAVTNRLTALGFQFSLA